MSKIEGRRNYSDKCVSGADSIRTSNIKDHSHSDQHAHAMMLLKKDHAQAKGLDASCYAPIVKALHELSEDAKSTLRIKFDAGHNATNATLTKEKEEKKKKLEEEKEERKRIREVNKQKREEEKQKRQEQRALKEEEMKRKAAEKEETKKIKLKRDHSE